MTDTKRTRQDELAQMGFGEAHYQRMKAMEEQAYEDINLLASQHPLAGHFEHIKGLGMYLCGAFVAASGDIERAPTVSSFWKGMGLDVLPDGSVPRRVRGRKGTDRRVPCLPHVSRVGEQIRNQMLRSQGRLYDWYILFKERYTAKYPDRPKLFNHKGALRLTQKCLYSALWREWRVAYGLPAPEPYAFDILRHNGKLITIEDFYEPVRGGNSVYGRARL